MFKSRTSLGVGAWLVLSSCPILYLVFVLRGLHATFATSHERQHQHLAPISWTTGDMYGLLNLTQEQCISTFPDLTQEIDATVALGPFTLKPSLERGPLQARIKDNQLYILHTEPEEMVSPEIAQSQETALHQLQRALATSPEPLPDTILTLNTRDQPFGSAFQYTRPALPTRAGNMPPLTRSFIMPPFALRSWPLPSVGSFSRAREAIDAIEAGMSFREKDPRVVWRGSARFESVQYPRLRADLLRLVEGEDGKGNASASTWADIRGLKGYEDAAHKDEKTTTFDDETDVEEDVDDAAAGGSETYSRVDGGDPATAPMLMIEDFCRYRYVLYTDGVTYSGRLPFHQLCRSVLISAPIAWRQYTTHLIKPLFSSDLDLSLLSSAPQTHTPERRSETGIIRRSLSSPAMLPSEKNIQRAWPVHYPPDEANAVFVSPDWSDLEGTVRWLEQHKDVAEGIARRQRDLFVADGYLSPAAEACYWRALVRAWNSVVQYEEDDKEAWEELGVPWENV